MLLQDAIDSLPETHQLAGALWLAAPTSATGRIVRLQNKTGMVGSALEPPAPGEPLGEWAKNAWMSAGEHPVCELPDDPAAWVRIVRSGARHVATGSTLLWGVELAADLATHPVMLTHLVRMAHRGTLDEGVLTADGCIALQVRHATRWSLVAE
jgi:hypothetical protein